MKREMDKRGEGVGGRRKGIKMGRIDRRERGQCTRRRRGRKWGMGKGE